MVAFCAAAFVFLVCIVVSFWWHTGTGKVRIGLKVATDQISVLAKADLSQFEDLQQSTFSSVDFPGHYSLALL